MLNKPLVSVIIPVYNAERYLAEAIESVLAQTYRPIEVIIVDDGSTDSSADIAKRYNSLVRYFFQPNSGLAAARNKGISQAKGSFFAFLDVTDPEPPAADSPLRRLENVVVVPHLAGCIEDCSHMGEMAVEELRRFFAGEPPLYAINPEMLKQVA